jgi:hypothetical protein
VQGAHDRPHQRGLSGAERAVECDDIACLQTRRETTGERLERRRRVEDVFSLSQNNSRCFCERATSW